MKRILLLAGLMTITVGASAQQTLTLEECRSLAVQNNETLKEGALKIEMSEYDKGIARSNYFPKISAKGMYLYNNPGISLIDDNSSAALRNAGTATQEVLNAKMTELTQAIMSNPAAAMEYMQSPMWQTVIGALSHSDVSNALNQIGSQVDDALHLDVDNLCIGMVSLSQPVFAGGKIVAANKIASLAEELAHSRYDTDYQEVLVAVEKAYWQVVSISAKEDLAEEYAGLLDKMTHDMDISVQVGVSDESEALSVKVKANEARMMLSKAKSGLALSKMLLCKEIGLPLDSEIILSEEGCNGIPLPENMEIKSMDEICNDRPELRSLELASDIYEEKVKVARADMMPTIALTANYILSNPNINNGFRNEFGGRLAAGVVVSVPIFHGYEAGYKTRKAKAEANLYRSKYEDSKKLIQLEIEKLKMERNEAHDRLMMAESNLDSAEENLRKASIGFEEGVVASNVAMAAHTAWLQAHNEVIDAGIELQMTNTSLRRAQGDMTNKQK